MKVKIRKMYLVLSILSVFIFSTISFSQVILYQPIGDEAITVTDSVTSLTAATYSGANRAYCGPLETAQIRYRITGDSPTTTVGHLLEVGQDLVLYGREIANFRSIRTGANSGTIYCTYEK